ncbi:MAG: cobyric acid synthase [Hyphomicrobiaceae bacterium]|nr:cobyric acid synthase [Hyphomicrobiaceae bacterium]
MFQGTGSDVGKSLIVAGLARAFTRRGLRVLPFKPQNMSNNAAVTVDGGEIGRAQALQARACGVKPSVDMNPVLLKPQSEVGAQVVVHGRAIGNARAQDYQTWKPKLMEAVLESFARLKANADLVLVEGAGSASEINLRRNDIANMGFARAANVPVVLIGDIDRGGVIAQIVGTTAVIDADDRAMLHGFLVNKFRGDPALFCEGMRQIEQLSGLPGFGLIPYFKDARLLPAEDAMALAEREREPHHRQTGAITIAVPVLPRISNFDDLDPLKMEPGVRLVMVRSGEPIPRDADVILLPGSKATLADLADLRREGWDVDIAAHARAGGRVLGICGGYQMLGQTIADPDGVEGSPGEMPGLGLLNVTTRMTGSKQLAEVRGASSGDEAAAFIGYEMHIGETKGPDRARPYLRFSDGRQDGAASADGRVAGCYVHGLFGADSFRAAWLRAMGAPASTLDYDAAVDRTLDALAAHLSEHVDLDGLLALAR